MISSLMTFAPAVVASSMMPWAKFAWPLKAVWKAWLAPGATVTDDLHHGSLFLGLCHRCTRSTYEIKRHSLPCATPVVYRLRRVATQAKPKLTIYHEEGCSIEFRRMTMTLEQQQQLLYGQGSCSGSGDCVASLALRFVAAAAELPISAIVSGSIVVVGNTIFWLQEQGQCKAAT
jgi:hypothetical protein